MKLKFSGRQALILGGSCELALVLARQMIRTDLYPILTSRSPEGRQTIKEHLQKYDGHYRILDLDFSDRHSLENLRDQQITHLDYAVDFAQGDYERLIAAADENQVYRYFEANISFRAAVIKRITRIMLKKKRGRLVFVSSSAAERPNPGQGFYAAAKLASEALYRNLGLEMAGRGITTVCLRPGYIAAGRGTPYIEDHDSQIAEKVPIKRPLTAEEIAQAILFYLSDAAVGFNAVALPMDGGLTAGK